VSDDNVRPLPGVAPHFDLDSYEVPDKEKREPFTIQLNGELLTFTDPQDAEWEELLNITGPHEFVRLCLSEEDLQKLYDAQLSSRKFNALLEAFERHYGIIDKVRKAQRDNQRLGL
jgi:hypothetical protein